MRDQDIGCRSCLNPTNWPISLKVAAGPVVLVSLLGLVILLGWSIADEHQRQLSQNYQEHAADEEVALRLPHLLARIQKDLYKLSIWAQIDAEGEEVTSTLQVINNNLNETRDLVIKLEERHSINDLKSLIRRYSEAVKQALILIERSPRVGAVAIRGIERVYLMADQQANELAVVARQIFEQQQKVMHSSWRQLVFRFLIILGAIGSLIPILALGSDRMIARPIKQLAFMVDRFRQGDLDIQVPWTARKDEIGLVARAMDSFRLNLIRNQAWEREREELNQELEKKVERRTRELAEQKERLAKALEKEHELNGLQRQFVSMVCHEFRTPLAIIDGNAQRIIKRHDSIPPDRIKTGLGKVRTSVTRLTELMESVLSASRLEAGTIDMAPAPSNLAEMIVEVASNHQEVNPNYKITTDVDQLPDRFTVDIKLMRQVVSNLISNAVKYSPEGSLVRVQAASSVDGGIEIAVRDRGVGIPGDELEKLFQRFFRASTSTGIAGTGIGLHMVKALVDMHGGRIDVSSEEGAGSTFTVYLPKRDDDHPPGEQNIEQAA